MISVVTQAFRDRVHLPASLRARAILMLFFALIPTSIVALMGSYAAYRQLAENERMELRAEVLQLDLRLEAAWSAASRLGQLIANQSAWQADFESTCALQLNDWLMNDDRYTSLSVFRDGKKICQAGTGAMIDPENNLPLPYLGLPLGGTWRGFVRRGAMDAIVIAVNVTVPNHGPLTVAVEVNRAFIARILGNYHRDPTAIAAIVGNDGRVIITGVGANTPHDLLAQSDTARSHPTPLESAAHDLTGFNARVMITIPSAVLLVPARVQIAAAIMTLILVITVTGASVWFGLYYLILRWVHAIGTPANAYAHGDLTARVGLLPGAPEEIASLARNFDAMCDNVAARNADLVLESMKQEQYLRDLHHHVKNTLQIASSLIALQMRAVPMHSREVLRFPFDRINAVAAAYAAYYGQGDPNHVAIGSLVTEVVIRLYQGSPDAHPTPQFFFTDPDAAIDLTSARTIAMLLAEILPPVIDKSGDRTPSVAIHVTMLPGHWRLEIRGPLVDDDQRDPLSNRLLNAHLRQLSAVIKRDDSNVLTIEFSREKNEWQPRGTHDRVPE